MSLMKTLAKVAVGVALAKGASSMMNKQGGGGAGGGLGGMLGQLAGGGSGAAGGLAGMLGGAMGGGAGSNAGGGLESMLGGMLGGGSAGGALGSGGLGGILEQLGGSSGSGGAGGLSGMLGGLAGGGAMAGLMGGLGGALAAKPQTAPDSFGAVLNSQFDETPEPALAPSADQEALAALMLRAMIQATKADGELDEGEQAKLVDRLGGDVDQEEAAFLQAELKRPLDVDSLVQDTPKGMEQQIYAMSVLGIDLDSQAEAQYLHGLAGGFGLDAQSVNSIHDQLGVPSLYS